MIYLIEFSKKYEMILYFSDIKGELCLENMQSEKYVLPHHPGDIWRRYHNYMK